METTFLIILCVVGGVWLFQMAYHLLVTDRVRRAVTAERKSADGESAPANGQWPSLSVIISACDVAPELERNLPLILEQDYEGKMEVIVVNDNSTDDTADVLERLKYRYPNLRTSFTGSTVRRISRRKLALTLGIKAAKHDWLVFTDANCTPRDNHWLRSLALAMTDDADAVVAYTSQRPVWGRRENQSKSGAMLRSYNNLRRHVLMLSAAIARHGYTAIGSNMAYRRQLFFDAKGYSRHLNLDRGDDNIFVHENVRPRRLRAVVDASSVMERPTLVAKQWAIECCGHLVTRRYTRCPMQFLADADLVVRAFYIAATIGAAVLFAIDKEWIGLGIIVALWGVRYAVLWLTARPVEKQFGEAHFSPWTPLLETWELFNGIGMRLHRLFTPKSTFLRKQI